MPARIVAVFLLLLLVGIHAQLWLGRTNVAHVQSMQQQIDRQQAENERARQENERLTAEVANLKNGLEMVEEKARSELGMVKPGEIFVQIAPAGAAR